MRSNILTRLGVAVVFLGVSAVGAYAQQCARGDNECIIRVNSASIRANPDDPEPYYDRAIGYRDTKQYALAKKDLDKYLQFPVTNKTFAADGHRVRAWVYHLMGDDKSAFDDIAKAFELNPDEHEGYYMRGMIYNASKNFARAVDELTKYIAANAAKPEFLADGYYHRGFAYNGMAKYELALNDLTAAIGYNKSSALFYKERAFTYRKMGKVSLAVADETKANELEP